MPYAHEIILIGGSAGSYDLILDIMDVVPTHMSKAICVVIHRNARYETQIETSLSKKLNRTITSVMDKTEIQPNGIYFAPPGYHLLVEPDFSFSLDSSEPINYSRPSIDALFESTAEIYKENCTAFLFSGANHDGGKGLTKILDNKGKAYVQNPREARISTMPAFGLKMNPTASILSKAEIIDYFRHLI